MYIVPLVSSFPLFPFTSVLYELYNLAMQTQLPQSRLYRLIFSDTRFAWLWLIVRLYLGWEWFSAGLEKLQSSAWVGSSGGSAVQGFISRALQKTAGAHPDVQSWYASYLRDFVLPNAGVFSHIVAYGELLVGIGLIIGAFTGIAAFFGVFMNASYLFAGTVSTNPILLFLGIFLIMSWRIAGWYGVDRYLLYVLGFPRRIKTVSQT